MKPAPSCLAILVFISLTLCGRTTLASPDIFFSDENIQILVRQMKNISETSFISLKNLDPIVFQPNTVPNHVFIMNEGLSNEALSQFAREKWRSLDFFASPFFQNDTRILYFPKNALRLINQHFDLGCLFPPAGINEISGNGFEIEGLLIGNGRMVLIYPEAIRVQRKDPPYSYITGRYEFYRVNVVQIDSSLNQFFGRNQPHEKLKPFLGPLGVPIKRITVRDNNQSVRVRAGVVWWTFEHPMIRRISTTNSLGEMPQAKIPPEKMPGSNNL